MKLNITHDARVGIREGQVADVCLVLLRESVLVLLEATGIDALNHLAKLEIKCDNGHTVDPAVKPVPLLSHCALLLCPLVALTQRRRLYSP